MTEAEQSPSVALRSPWTRLAVDPLALPLGTWLAGVRGVTPSRVTALAGSLAVISATLFALGEWRWGGLAFLARYFFDCVDGQVARTQGSASRLGASFDLMADVGGIGLVTAALCGRLVYEDMANFAVPLALLASMVYYNWILAYRKSLAAEARLEFSGGVGGGQARGVPGLQWLFDITRRIGMTPVPWAIEIEILMLGIGPLFFPVSCLGSLLFVGIAFYLLANVVNTRRVVHIARDIDNSKMKD